MFHQLGYTHVDLLEGGLSGWQASGGELFKDVNVPSARPKTPANNFQDCSKFKQ
jgi:3-mercaptopyruvate sulfurtransferase SseA